MVTILKFWRRKHYEKGGGIINKEASNVSHVTTITVVSFSPHAELIILRAFTTQFPPVAHIMCSEPVAEITSG